jgi:hypothetical protein
MITPSSAAMASSSRTMNCRSASSRNAVSTHYITLAASQRGVRSIDVADRASLVARARPEGGLDVMVSFPAVR